MLHCVIFKYIRDEFWCLKNHNKNCGNECGFKLPHKGIQSHTFKVLFNKKKKKKEKKKPKNIVINIHRLCHLLCSRESMREYMGNKIIKYSTELQHLLTE